MNISYNTKIGATIGLFIGAIFSSFTTPWIKCYDCSLELIIFAIVFTAASTIFFGFIGSSIKK
jgi:hypothetical protein